MSRKKQMIWVRAEYPSNIFCPPELVDSRPRKVTKPTKKKKAKK